MIGRLEEQTQEALFGSMYSDQETWFLVSGFSSLSGSFWREFPDAAWSVPDGRGPSTPRPFDYAQGAFAQDDISVFLLHPQDGKKEYR